MILAQTLVQITPSLEFEPDETEKKVWAHMYESLSLLNPTTDHHSWLEMKATRYVFEEDVSSIAYNLQSTGQVTTEGVVATARLPAPRTWVEWPYTWRKGDPDEEKMRVGVLMCESPDEFPNEMLVSIFCHVLSGPYKGKCGAIAACRVAKPPFNIKEKASFDIVWRAQPNDGVEEDDWRASLGQYVLEAFYALMLITMPKVSEIRQQEFGAKHCKKRREAGKEPLLSFHKVLVRIGKSARYESREGHSTGGGGRKKYHRVEPFFRTVKSGPKVKDDKPRLEYVTRHYRGDPELGISISEKHVVR